MLRLSKFARKKLRMFNKWKKIAAHKARVGRIAMTKKETKKNNRPTYKWCMTKQKSHQIECDLEFLLLEIQQSLGKKKMKYVNCKTFGIHVANKGCTGKLVTKVNDRKKNCLCSVHCALCMDSTIFFYCFISSNFTASVAMDFFRS